MRLFISLMVIMLWSCSNTTEQRTSNSKPEQTKLKIITTSFPVDYLTKRLIGNRADVHCINPIGEDPPEFSPPAEEVAKLAGADLIVKNGVNFENWMQTASIPLAKVVDSSVGIELIPLKEETHSHGKKGSHSHKGFDPHIWSNPDLYAIQAENIAKRLVQAAPHHRDSVNAELAKIKTELKAIALEMSAVAKPLRILSLSANHGAFDYLGKATGLTIHNFDFDPDSMPTESERMEWRVWKEKSKGTILLWESEPKPEVAAAFTGATHVTLDPLEQPMQNSEYDYQKQALANVAVLKKLAQDIGLRANENTTRP